MGNLKDKLLSIIDNGAVAAKSMIDTMNETMNSIDWNAQLDSLMVVKDSLMERGSKLVDEFNELMKRVKDNIADFEVIVPFDESLGEKFSYTINGDKLEIVVSYKDENVERSNKTTVNIPQNCDTEKATQKYNSLNKTMAVIIPKVITEPKGEENVDEGEKKDSNTASDATSKLLKKFHEHARGGVNVVATPPTSDVLPRGKNGRFVKRNQAN